MSRANTNTPVRRPAWSAAIVAASALLSGCNVAGPAFFLIHGPQKVKAQYTLPRDKSAVVFIDDRANVLPSRAARQRASRAAERKLLDKRAVGKADIVSSDAIMSLSAQERFGKPTGIAEVGKAVGASTIVYATVDSFALSPDGQQFAPTAELRVKVLDAETRRRLWPTGDNEWAPVQVRQPNKSGLPPTSTADRTKAEYELAEWLGQTVAELFVEHEDTDLARRVGE